jgi:glucokinase
MAATRQLGLDLGGTNIKLVVIEIERDVAGEASPRIVTSSSVPTEAERGPDHVARRMIEAGRAFASSNGPVSTAGAGVPGIFEHDTERIVLFPNLPGPWTGFPLGARLAEGLGLPVRLINDARAFVLAESRLGAGRGCPTIVGLTLGTGIGGGVIVDGRLRLGSTGTAGEVGHQTVDPGGPECGCGNRGCVEAIAQAGAIAERAAQPTAKAAFDAAAASDQRARESIEVAARALGVGIANLVTVLVPDAVVLGGGMAASDLLFDEVRKAVAEHTPLLLSGVVRIVRAELGPTAGAVGAALAGAGVGLEAISS